MMLWRILNNQDSGTKSLLEKFRRKNPDWWISSVIVRHRRMINRIGILRTIKSMLFSSMKLKPVCLPAMEIVTLPKML
jgi:hypothetical protein